MLKIAWVLLPLSLYLAGLLFAWLRGRAPTRMGLNVHLSLLLMAYLLATAGLGIFWVANQQLPVFDWHYLFGYATLILLMAHLFFNLPIAVRWLTRGRSKATGKVQVRWGLVAGIMAVALSAYYVGLRQGAPGMPVGRGPLAADAGRATIIDFHEYSSESRSSVFRRAASVDWGDEPESFKRYDGPGIALPAPRGANAALSVALRGPAGKVALDLQHLSTILHLSAGVTSRRGGNALRASPSSGALFPSELYVLAHRVAGLAPGVYHYDPDKHRLDRIDSRLPEAEADASIAVSAIFRRTGYKYHDRAYRYAAADAGHLLENLRLATHASGAAFALPPRFDEMEVARTLRIDGVEEGVLSLALINPVRPVNADQRAFRQPGAPKAGDALGATALVHQATSLRAASSAGSRTEGESILLPAAAPLALPIRQVIESRRSQRRFSGDAVPMAALSAALAAMAQDTSLSPAIRIQVIVNRAEGLEPGVYRYLPGHALRRVRGGQLRDEAQSAALSQDVIGDAAVVLVLSADRDLMLQDGPRGYRHGFLEAGMIGERWLLAAVASGLGACPVGAFYDDEAARLIGVDPKREWVLHFAALGVIAP
jgi:SagB-type dehydrogenase family enzyme